MNLIEQYCIRLMQNIVRDTDKMIFTTSATIFFLHFFQSLRKKSKIGKTAEAEPEHDLGQHQQGCII